MDFDGFFKLASGDSPFEYQRRLALGDEFPQLVHAPTGSGKTAAAVLGWLWRRRHAGADVRSSTPRRLVYCLPMRVLVEQTHAVILGWLERLSEKRVHVHRLMGGISTGDWDVHPEREAILIGTQDMLLSRALNRGYGASRYRWPVPFALLNNDCLWVLDEIQLMGSGLATTTQLQAFRQSLKTFGPTGSMWMSATLRPDWLASVDFRSEIPDLKCLTLEEDKQSGPLVRRYAAKKTIERASIGTGDRVKSLAALVRKEHRDGSLTLIILNTVERAKSLFKALSSPAKGKAVQPAVDPEIVLIHSRFRPEDRKRRVGEMLAPITGRGRIVVSTQVVEAGVDISARTLFTEIAPWSSLIQRFGRCNRRGEFNDARVFWIDLESTKDAHLPYDEEGVQAAREVLLGGLADVGPRSIDEHLDALPEADRSRLFPFVPENVLRRKDLIDLFDTTPDLAGNDIDVARFIRDGDDLDVQVFWRGEGAGDTKAESEITPGRNELCPVPISQFREFISSKKFLAAKKQARRWDALNGMWQGVAATSVLPGQVYLLLSDQGGYTEEMGWNPDSSAPVIPIAVADRRQESYGDELDARDDWKSIAEHTDEVHERAGVIIDELGFLEPWRETILDAARWHDRGKAHPAFQGLVKDDLPEELVGMVAKAPDGAWRGGPAPAHPTPSDPRRKLFRHELASALAAIQAGKSDLVAYLDAASHGKVRLSIRSLPDEPRPPDESTLFARGVWHDDVLPATDLGGDQVADAVKLDLSLMILGRDGEAPSWAERMIRLRDHPELGAFRLAFLETVLRAADIRASKGEKRATDA